MPIQDKFQEATKYLKDNNLRNKSSASLALKNKFGINYADWVKQAQETIASRKSSSQNNTPVKAETPKRTEVNSGMKKKTLDTAGANNLNSQLKELGYDSDQKIRDYYTKNNIEYKPQTTQPTPRIETPSATDTNVATKKDAGYKPATSFQDWMNRGKKPTELIDIVESKYGVNAEYDPTSNTVVGFDENGEKSKVWTFDKGGNPIREDLYTSGGFLGDFQGMIDSGSNKDQIHSFLKKNISLANNNREKVRDMYKTFLKQDKINTAVSGLVSLDGKGLFDAYSAGKFVKGDDVWNALPPETQAQFDAYWASNIRTLASKTDGEGNLVPIVANLESNDEEEIFNALAQHNPEYQKKFNEIVVNNPERKELREDLTSNYALLEEKRAELNKLKAKIKKQYPSASPSFINAKINKERSTLLDEIDDLTAGYNTSLMSYNLVDADVQAEYGAYSQDAQIEMATYQQAVNIKLDRLKTADAFANQKEIIELQAEQSRMATEQNQAFQWKIKQFDAKRADEGGEYITNNKGQVMYVTKSDPTNAKLVLDTGGTPISTKDYQNYTEKLIENDDGSFTVIRTFKDGTAPTVSTYNQQGQMVGGTPAIVNEAMRKIPDTGKQCGEAVNDYLENLGLNRIMQDGYDTPAPGQTSAKTDHINSEDPAIGGLAIWNPSQWSGGKYAENGHVGIITGVSSDGESLEITSWNMNGDEKKTVDMVSRKEIESNGGYHTPKVSGVVSTDGDDGIGTGGQLSVDAQSWVDLWNKGTMDIETIMTKIGSSKESLPLKTEITRYINEQGGVAYRSHDDPVVKNMQSLENTVSNILSSKYLHTVSGTVQRSPTNFMTGGKSDVLADLKFLIEGQTLQELIDAKANGATFGALSNEELKMLQASASSIAANAIRDPDTNEIKGFRMSEDKFVAELEKMKKAFAGKVDRMTGSNIDSFDPMGLRQDGYGSGDDPLGLFN